MSKPTTANVLPGLGWMALCGGIFACFMLVLKQHLEHVPAVQSGFMRYVGGLFWLLPFVYVTHRKTGQTLPLAVHRFDKAIYARAVAHALGVCLWFYAIVGNAIADISALSNLGPIYATLGAVLVFGERLKLRRILAIVVSIMGALLIIRPGFESVNQGIYAMLLATPIFSISDLLGKRLAQRQSSVVMILQLTLIVSLFLALPALYVWQPVSGIDWGWAIVIGLLASLGHVCLNQAFKASEMWVVQSGKFFQLISAAWLGWLVLGDAVPLTTWLGGGLIVLSISYIAWREAQLARLHRSAPQN